MSPRKKLFQKTIMIRMPEDLCASLSALADKDGRSLSDYCRATLRTHVEAGDNRAYRAVYPATKEEFEDMVRKMVKELMERRSKSRGKA